MHQKINAENDPTTELFRSDIDTYIQKRQPVENLSKDFDDELVDLIWNPGRILMDEYRVEKVLGKGGVGTVYLVKRLSDDELLAAKTLYSKSFREELTRRLFYRELRHWIALPNHPHLVTCRYFKTMDRQMVIFSEYVDGGTLFDHIERMELLEIDKILDVCIQIAWGLAASHSQGLIHQDIKPSNIMMTSDGMVKITDFGISSFTSSGYGAQDQFMRRCMTKAYCSPEQSMIKPLTFATDIWSFGVVMMEMFTGKLASRFGFLAGDSLNLFESKGPYPPFPVMPRRVLRLIRKCFELEPENRWESANAMALELMDIYREYTGKPYRRPRPPDPPKLSVSAIQYQRKTPDGMLWADPIIWLSRASILKNEKFYDDSELLSVETNGSTGKSINDLDRYNQAIDIYRKYIENTSLEPEFDFANLLMNKAVLQHSLADDHGSIDTLNMLEDYLYSKYADPNESERLFQLVQLYLMRGRIYISVKQFKRAFESIEKGLQISISEDLEYLILKSKLLLNQGIVQCSMNQHKAGIECIDSAIDIVEKLISDEEMESLADELPIYYLNRTIAGRRFGSLNRNKKFFDASISTIESLVNERGMVELKKYLGNLYMNRSIEAGLRRDINTQINSIDKAIGVLYESVETDGFTENRIDLAEAYLNKSIMLNHQYRESQSISICKKAVRILENEVFSNGRLEYIDKLARGYVCLGQSQHRLEENDHAVIAFEKALKIFKKLIENRQREDLRDIYCHTMFELSGLYQQFDRNRDAIEIGKMTMNCLDKSENKEFKHHILKAQTAGRLMQLYHMDGSVELARELGLLAIHTLEHIDDETQRQMAEFRLNWIQQYLTENILLNRPQSE